MAHLLHAKNTMTDKTTDGLCPGGTYWVARRRDVKPAIMSVICGLEASKGRKAK